MSIPEGNGVDRYQAMTTFVRVVETGSFSAAARLLNVGQPAVSKTIAQLENRLPVSLLIRSTHGLSPTEVGLHYYERARAAIQEVSVTVHGRVRLSAAEGLRAAVLADMGLTIASDWMFAEELANGRVRKVLQDWNLPPIDLWAVFPTGRMASAKARQFAFFVETVMAESRKQYSGQE